MHIDASLFAHIENDSALEGTYKLEGHEFLRTVSYLQEYLDSLAGTGSIPPEYIKLLKNLRYLVNIEQKLNDIRAAANPAIEIKKLAASIALYLEQVPLGESLLLPGGWINSEDGHKLVYDFTRKQVDYHFTVYNSGDGLEYHEKKSSKEKELYNPMKRWKVPTPVSEKERQEVAFFIESLLLPQIQITNDQKKPVTAKVLYQEMLSTGISHLKGVEIEIAPKIRPDDFTGGQLSGTCAQRILHQILKLLSPTPKEYQRFIFKFKQYALFDFANACFNGQQPFNQGVKDQINLAIENNLKIMNTPFLLGPLEIEEEIKKITALQEQLKHTPCPAKGPIPPPPEQTYSFDIKSNTIRAPKIQLDPNLVYNVIPPLTDLSIGTNLLENLTRAIKLINTIKSPETQFVYLQQLILKMPLFPDLKTDKGFYKEIKSINDFERFRNHLDDIQNLLLGLQSNWLQKEQNPKMNVLILSTITLQESAQTAIQTENKTPSFLGFSQAIMRSLVNNQKRNPFYATNDPALDKRFKDIQTHYKESALLKHEQYFDFFRQLLNTEPSLRNELDELYDKSFGKDVTELHDEVRKNRLKALYLITQDIEGINDLDPKFLPIKNKVLSHIKYESQFRKAINPFYEIKYYDAVWLHVQIDHNTFRVNTPLFPTFVPYEKLLKTLSKSKYDIEDSPARDALEADICSQSVYRDPIKAKTANYIQLHPAKVTHETTKERQVTQNDIVSRDYFHLRSDPSLQIPLTLDYFIRNIEKLADESDQRYVEANLFQSDLLLAQANNPQFLQKFDLFLKKGLRFFTENGRHTKESILFLRLNFLVNRYLILNRHPEGLSRLQNIHEQIKKQLVLNNKPEMVYMLQHYLFLTLITQMEMGEGSDDIFMQTYRAFTYINSHTNPQILEDKAHRIEVDCAVATFQLLLTRQSSTLIEQAVNHVLTDFKQVTDQKLQLKGSFPLYTLENNIPGATYQFNALLGKLFEQKLAQSGVPLVIQNHPLIKELELEHVKECLMNTDGTYMLFPNPGDEVHLFYNNNKLIVQKMWRIKGHKQIYELQPLTWDHQAYYANHWNAPLTTSLPPILTDGSINYWQHSASNYSNSVTKSNAGILVQDNIPVYCFNNGVVHVLDSNGQETGYQLSSDTPDLLKSFESTKFIINQTNSNSVVTKLPRYNLIFELKHKTLINQETGEEVIDRPSSIHPDIAGLVLANKEQKRFIVPIARFYPTEDGAEQSDYYPLIHDIHGTIADESLRQHWNIHRPKQKPMWHYANSEQSVSFQLKNGVPIANSIADALYLAYIYMATNQTEKAWNTLEECTTRLGGLTGDPAELKYIQWICQQMPHILPSEESLREQKKPVRNTPPYVACQLKAMSLLCDYQIQKGAFNLSPNKSSDTTANEVHESLNHQHLQAFLTNLPALLHKTFSRLQLMRRHLEHTYTLSTLERKRLLDFYHQSQPKNHVARGALGFEWLSLSLETLLEEKNLLLSRQRAQQLLNLNDRKRLDFIEEQLQKLKPVMAHSTQLELVPIDLTLPSSITITKSRLQPATLADMDLWAHRLPGAPKNDLALEGAINCLTSQISIDEFLINFPAFIQIACSNATKLRAELLDFCVKTLMANRHVNLKDHTSDIPFLCNILYRMLHSEKVQLSRGETYKLDELIEHYHDYPVASLCVYQAKDICEDILATPEELIREKNPRESIPIPAPKDPQTSFIDQVNLIKYLQCTDIELLRTYSSSYKKIQSQNDHELAKLAQSLQNNLEQLFIVEEKAGHVIFDTEQKKREQAQLLIDNQKLTRAIISAAKSAQAEIKQSWSKALKKANAGPKNIQHPERWAIEIQAKARPTLNQADLQLIYARADLTYTIEKTGLSSKKAHRLHQLIHQTLIKGIQHQALQKIIDDLQDASSTNDASLAAQALDVLSRSDIPGLEEPSLVLIQHEDKILLRPRQVSAFNSLLKEPKENKRFNEIIEKIPMGGGKSKVILPVLAEKKAQGDNLVVIEVPQALLKTNYIDLNNTSQRLFKKRAYLFEFNRDTSSAPEDLEKIYRLFVEIITTKSYMVTAGESIQSLELKYEEILFSEEKHDETWKMQVFWLDQINNLLRHNGDALIDEVDQGLSIKKRLNYTSGKPKPLSSLFIKNSIALFSFIDPELIKNAPSYKEDFDWTPFKIDLATKLVNDPNSPLHAFITDSNLRYGPTNQNTMIAYLCNTAETMPDAVIHANDEIKESLGFFKQEINVRLPQTLPQRLDKDYGASKRKDLKPLQKTMAIPYLGTNVPNERNRFKDEIESINKMIQMMVIKGISKEQLLERIREWQALARQEVFQTNNINETDKTQKDPNELEIDKTPTAKGFALLTTGLGLQLSQVNCKDEQQMSELHKRFQFSLPLIFDFLREFALHNIQQDGSILASDSYNHVDQYRSVQGVSGTPSMNHTIYHPRLHFDKATSLGTDGYMFEVIRSKKPQISSCDYVNATQFINAILSKASNPKQTRAIIDIKGTFTGVNNLEVAQELARFINLKPGYFDKPLKHVLYFNEDQVLCAIAVNTPQKPILLGTSETNQINDLLNSTPEERFTFYDEIHKRGADMKQQNNAHLIGLVDDKTDMEQFLQGATRFRDLEFNQTLEIVVPSSMQGMSLEDLGQKFKNNEKRAIVMDAPSAAQGQLKNHIRRILLSIVQDFPAVAEKKATLLQHFRPLFEDTPSLNLFALYGGINKEETVHAILEDYKIQMSRLWETQLKAAQRPPHAEEIQHITLALQKIIERIIPFCLPKYPCLDNSFSKEVEVQIQKIVEVEVLKIKETYNTKLVENKEQPWPKYLEYRSFFTSAYQASLKTYTLSLNEVCKSKVPIFSNQLFASINYITTHTEQKERLDGFLKPVFLIWYHLEYRKLHAMIVTPQEARELERRIQNITSSWIATTEDTVIGGNCPKNILMDNQYQDLREQIRFFNGEFSSLLQQDTPLNWLKEKSEIKLSFYKTHVLPFRPGSESMLHQLTAALTQGSSKAFEYIAKHPFEDLTQFNWQVLLPETIPIQALEYKKLAEAYVYLNKNWMAKSTTIEELQQQFRLSMNTLFYLDIHLKHLMALKDTLLRCTTQPSLFSIKQLDLKERTCIEKCLGITLDEFCAQRSTGHDKGVVILGIELLNALSAYPALKHETILSVYYEQVIDKVTTKHALIALIGISNPTEKFLQKVLKHPSYESSLLTPILTTHPNLSEEILVSIVELGGHHQSELELIKKQKGLSEPALKMLLKGQINEAELDEILKSAKSIALIARIGLHVLAAGTFNERLFNSPLCNRNILLYLIDRRSYTDAEIELILNHRLCDLLVVDALLNKFKLNKAHFMIILNKPWNDFTIKKIFQFADREVRTIILQHDSLSTILTQIMLDQPFYEEELKTVINRQDLSDNLIQVILNKPKLNESLLIEILEKRPNSDFLLKIYKHPSANGTIYERVLKHPMLTATMYRVLLEDVKLPEYQLLLMLEHPIVPLLVNNLINEIYCHPRAGEEVRSYLLQHANLSPHALVTILRNHQLPEHRLSMVLKRDVLLETTIDSFLKQSNISEEHLIQILKKHCKTEQRINEIYHHRIAKKTVPEYVLQHGLFSLAKIRDLLFHGNLSEKELLLILDSPKSTAFNSNILEAIYKHDKASPAVHKRLLEIPTLYESLQLFVCKYQMPEHELELVLNHPNMDAALAQSLITQPQFTKTMLLQLLQHQAMTNDFINLISDHKLADGDVLSAVISHAKANNKTLRTVISSKAFEIPVAEKILTQPYISSALIIDMISKVFNLELRDLRWAQYIVTALIKAKNLGANRYIIPIIRNNKDKITADLGLKLLNHLPEIDWVYLPLKTMIQIATKEEINKIINVNFVFSQDIMTELTCRNLDAQQIDTVLERKEMTSVLADSLFNQKSYNGTIRAWDWLRKDQLLAALDRAKDFNSLKLALTHKGLITEEDAEGWLESVREIQGETARAAVESHKIELKLKSTLNELRIKACSHVIKSLKNPQYDQAARDAFGLFHTLSVLVEEFIANPSANAARFKSKCTTAINEVKPCLEQHRGYKQILLDILNVIFAVTALFRKGNWRLFEANTASMNIVNDVIADIDSIIETRANISA